MKSWIIITSGYKQDGIIINFSQKSFTSLKDACNSVSISYAAAIKWKRLFVENDTTYLLKQIETVKIKGRENNYKSKSK